MKLTDPRRKESTPLDYPLTDRREKDNNFFQVNEMAFTRKRSSVLSSSPSKSL